MGGIFKLLMGDLLLNLRKEPITGFDPEIGGQEDLFKLLKKLLIDLLIAIEKVIEGTDKLISGFGKALFETREKTAPLFLLRHQILIVAL